MDCGNVRGRSPPPPAKRPQITKIPPPPHTALGGGGRNRLPDLSPDYEIRQARRHEIAAIRKIEIAAAEIIPEEDLPAEMRERGMLVGPLEQAVADGRLFIAICLSENSPVGFALATRVDDSGHLRELDVLPSHGRRGLGRALVQAVVEWAEQLGFPSLTLTTFRHLPFNAPFYQRLGFCGLPDEGLPEQLEQLLVEEARNGLDRSTRIAMSLALAPANPGD